MEMKNIAGSWKKNKTKRSSSPLPAHITPQVTVTLHCKQANTPSPHFAPKGFPLQAQEQRCAQSEILQRVTEKSWQDLSLTHIKDLGITPSQHLFLMCFQEHSQSYWWQKPLSTYPSSLVIQLWPSQGQTSQAVSLVKCLWGQKKAAKSRWPEWGRHWSPRCVC